MKMSDQELTLYAFREAQLILADYVHPGPRDCDKTINALLSVLDRDDNVEAVDRLEAASGMYGGDVSENEMLHQAR